MGVPAWRKKRSQRRIGGRAVELKPLSRFITRTRGGTSRLQHAACIYLRSASPLPSSSSSLSNNSNHDLNANRKPARKACRCPNHFNREIPAEGANSAAGFCSAKAAPDPLPVPHGFKKQLRRGRHVLQLCPRTLLAPQYCTECVTQFCVS